MALRPLSLLRRRRPRRTLAVGAVVVAALVGVAGRADTAGVGGWAWPGSPPAATGALGPSAGCAAAAATGSARTTVVGLDVDGTERRYRLSVPSATAVPAPLVVALHGYSSGAAALAATSGLERSALDAGVVLAVPDGLGSPRRWSLPGLLPGGDDLALVRALLDEVASTTCVDLDRVVVAGFSNGAGMASALGCALGDRIAALVLVAGANLDVGCPWPDARPTAVVHGDADPVVPLGGGPVLGGALHAVPLGEAVAARRAVGAPVELHVVEGWDHRWPTAAAGAALDATALVLAVADDPGSVGRTPPAAPATPDGPPPPGRRLPAAA